MADKYNVKPTSYDDIKQQASRLIRKIINDVHSQILDLMREPKSGAIYYKEPTLTKTGRKKKRPKTHQASAPGEAPAVDTGFLWNSITAFTTRATVGVIGVGAKYGIFLEEGTTRMAPRPFVEPAMNGVLTKLQSAGVISKFEKLNFDGKL